MTSLASLDALMPNIPDSQMEAQGLGIWFTWEGDKDSTLNQLMEEYGGILVLEEKDQSLWFFFTADACLALARLRSWPRFNQSSLFAQIFASKIIVGKRGEKKIICGEAILSQKIEEISRSQIWVHPSATEAVEGILGLSLMEAPLHKGMSDDGWQMLDVDTRLPYQSNLGWYAVLRPVGKASEKKFQKTWREFSTHLEDILQRRKNRYNTRDLFFMFPIEGIRQLKSWCIDYHKLINELQNDKPEEYWPCVMAIVDKKGLNFNNELPEKIGLDWGQLTPDFPHMTKENALKLGPEFSFHEDRFMPIKNSPEDWCSISLDDDRGLADANLLPNLVPLMAMGTEPYCFYCGQRSHKMYECPTREMENREEDIWKHISLMDLSTLEKNTQKLEQKLKGISPEDFKSFLRETSPEANVLKAGFDIGWAGQIRSIPFFWQARDKELNHKVSLTSKDQKSAVWPILDEYSELSPENIEKELNAIAGQSIRDFRVPSLRGFVAMEKGEVEKAINFWNDAEALSPFPAVASWHSFLQARACECSNDIDKAVELYEKVGRACPSWRFISYRQAVCQVKRGFSSEALDTINNVVMRDGNFFNKILLDPELERGHIQIFSHLMDIWRRMESIAKEEEIKLKKLNSELYDWFENDHPFAEKASARIESLLQMGRIKNFVTLQSVANGRLEIEKNLQDYVNNAGIQLKASFQQYGQRLQQIKKEAAWFPFPSILAEFNKIFNKSATEANWIFKANLGQPDAFKKANKMTEDMAEQVEYLEGRMRTLCLIRDATLFILSLVQTFFWIEIIGIILIFIILPLILIYGENIGLSWTAGVIASHRFEVQKVLFMLLSILAIGIASLRTVLSFEKIREKILDKAQKGPSKRQIRRAQKRMEKAKKAQTKKAQKKEKKKEK